MFETYSNKHKDFQNETVYDDDGVKLKLKH